MKSLLQRYTPSENVLGLMRDFKAMTNICIQIGLEHDATNLKWISLLAQKELSQFKTPSYYKYCAVSRAAGILSARKKSIRRGYQTKEPYQKALELRTYMGFKIIDGCLHIPFINSKRPSNRQREAIPLTKHTLNILSDPSLKVRAFTLSDKRLGLCVSKEVPELKISSVVGVDRNLNNLTVGNEKETTVYNLSEVTRITETTRSIARSLKRKDVRLRKRVIGKYGQRRTNRVHQLLHRVSKQIVESALKNKQGIVFEDLQEIRKLYQKGNWQKRWYRGQMNGWPFHAMKRQITYKAQWLGVPVVTLTKSETGGTSVVCPKCGERLQSSKELRRKLWCSKCREMFDRDIVAAVNIARRGRARFTRSECVRIEAMEQESNDALRVPMVILKVDLTKPTKQNPQRPLGSAGESQ